MSSQKEIKVILIGIGNCASALIQGIGYYSEKKQEDIIGLIHNDIGGYKISDINIVGGIDVNISKIGKSVGSAIFQSPNCTKVFFEKEVFSAKIIPGPILDGISKRMNKKINTHTIEKTYEEWKQYIVGELKNINADILVNYLPVGSEIAARFYAECALEAGIGFANAMPTFICSSPERADKFSQANIPCAGDDIKSQVGATIIHRCLIDLINKRGQKIDNTYQLNVGGNTDFENMLDEERLITKRISKTEAVKSLVNYDLETRIGPSDYVGHLDDNKICYINIQGRQFGDIPFSIDLKLSVEDSPNSAGVMVDVIRLLKLAKDRRLKGYQDFSCYYFKHPMFQKPDDEAYVLVNTFIK